MTSEPDESSRTGSQKPIEKLFKMSWLRALLGVHGPEVQKIFALQESGEKSKVCNEKELI